MLSGFHKFAGDAKDPLGEARSTRSVRRFSAAALLFLLLGAILTACGAEDEPAPAAASRGRLQMLRQSPFLSLSGEAHQIFGIDVDRIRRLPVYDGLQAVIFGHDGVRRDQWNTISRDLGYNPWDRIDQVVLGFYRTFELNDPFEHCMVVMTGTWENELDLMEALGRYARQEFMLEDPVQLRSEYRGYAVYTSYAPSRANPGEIFEMNFAFPTEGMAVFSRAQYLVPEAIDVIENFKPSIQETPRWNTLLQDVQLDSLVWGAGTFPRAVNQYIEQQIEEDPQFKLLVHLNRAEQFHLNIQHDGDYHVRVGLMMPNIDLARGMATDLKKGGALFRKIAEQRFGPRSPKVDAWMKLHEQMLASTAGETATVSIRLSREEAGDLVRVSSWVPTPTPTPLVIPPPFRPQASLDGSG